MGAMGANGAKGARGAGGKKTRVARRRRRRRRLAAAAAGAAIVVAGVAGFLALRGPRIVIPDDPCTERPPLRTVRNVTLQPQAMVAFRAAQRRAGIRIRVVESYRSCRGQRLACERICGDPAGCPGSCAAPGKSWHQLGAAIDIAQEALDDRRIIRALGEEGWCQPLPESDPGHFSYDGCH